MRTLKPLGRWMARVDAAARKWRAALPLAGLLAGVALGPACLAQPAASPQHLRIVGGLGALNQFTRHEEPFWTKDLARLTGGRATAEIVPFDRAGIRGQEMLRLVQLGAVPFGTSLLNLSAIDDAEFGAMDLAALNPDMATLRRTASSFRPHLEKAMRDRYGIELLALYAYPAQVTFCSKPLANLSDLAGRRVRISSSTQSDWVEALGALPVQAPLGEVVANIRSGNIDCAITGTMSGNTIGLHEVTSHVQTLPVNWGVAAFVANGAAWQALPKDLQDLMRRELSKLEEAIWIEAERETSEGIACNTGSAACTGTRKGRMTEVKATQADALRMRQILVKNVLPGWIKRCGPKCNQVWVSTVGPASGIALE
jgi:TRAP-type C4-dicarboxylate transport system substrate-binding protein